MSRLSVFDIIWTDDSRAQELENRKNRLQSAPKTTAGKLN